MTPNWPPTSKAPPASYCRNRCRNLNWIGCSEPWREPLHRRSSPSPKTASRSRNREHSFEINPVGLVRGRRAWDCEKSGCRSRRTPFAFRYTFYRFLTVAASLAESTTYGAVTVRERQKVPGIRVHLNAAKKQLDFFTTP